MVRPTPRLHLRRIPGVARELHVSMMRHFAEGNLHPVEKDLCAGLLRSLRARLAPRTPGMSMRWTLHRYLARPRLMSYKVVLLPPPAGDQRDTEVHGLVQAVVRIHSLQSVRHVKRVRTREEGGRLGTREMLVDVHGALLPDEEQVADSGVVPKDAKAAVEYLVIQKSVRKSKEGPWMVWGTTEETSLEKLRADHKKSQQIKLSGKSSA